MTQSSSSTNTNNDKTKMKRTKNRKSNLVRHTIGSYWWLAFACGVVYFFAGPVFTLLYLNGMNFDDSGMHYLPGELQQQNVEQIARWMSTEGMLPLYLSAVVLSMILGCVMFSYLQHRRQVNFYHSQPIHRTRLFINQYGVGFVLNMVLMLVMLALSMLLIVMYGLGDGLAFGSVLRHVGNIVVLSLASYSISVLAGQLTGTVLTHLALMLVLHFGIPVAAVVVLYMGDIFFATFDMNFPMAIMNFSPLCAMFTLLTEYNTRYLLEMTAPAMSGTMLAILLAIGIGFAVLSWALYQKRPSEATGNSLIYPITEPFVKAYLMFVGALGGGFIFYAVGDKAFFYFGVIVFAVLIHMVCQVIIEHDFKALFRKMNHCAVIVVVICAVVGIARFDLLGYDSYLPEPDKVKAVSFKLNSVDDYWGDITATEDLQVKQHVYDLLKLIIDDEVYRSSRFDGYHSVPLDAGDDTTSISVTYTLSGGREATRLYRAIPVSSIKDSYAALYNLQAYRESFYADILQADFEKVVFMNVDNVTLYSPNVNDVRESVAYAASQKESSYKIVYDTVQTAPMPIHSDNRDSSVPVENSREAKELAQNLLAAYQADLLDRDFSTLEQVQEQHMTIQILQGDSVVSNKGYSARHYTLPVYASDERTMAILRQYGLHQVSSNYDYELALIFRCENASEQNLRNILNEIPKYAEKGLLTEQELLNAIASNNAGEVVGRIEGKDAINAFIEESKLKNSGGMFRTFDNTHYVLLQYPYSYDESDAKEWRIELFYSDTVPSQYQ